ncbi:hypothetical protein [Paracidovorax wautersii]|uniref:Uncharacterized protein n=1 Tax=Paracidovorax wautersii TaxID=1177982 RepID=A0A1I2E723_9BURK|nr:hypothetical protein [Paracidovorax wautersii]SFE88291.1 hypothetical protein SAMN04489711_106251 [Paracidovorax wautersii]
MRRATAFFAPLLDSGPRRQRLRQPGALPQITDTPSREFARGWWAGIAIGLVNGAALAVLLGWLR